MFCTSCGANHITINPFFSSFETNNPSPLLDSPVTPSTNLNYVQTRVTTGPINGYGTKTTDQYGNSKGYGYTGFNSFEYKAEYISDNVRTSFTNYIYKDLNVIIGDESEFSYKLFPNFADSSNDDLKHNLNYLSTFVSVDLLYNNDNTANNLQSLSKTNIKDVNGNGLSPQEQGSAKCLFSYQWNLVKVDLKPLVGKHIHAITINYDMQSPDRTREYYGDLLNGDPTCDKVIDGYIDDVSIQDKKNIDDSSLTNYIDTRRGTDGHMDWSRGSNFPATCLPHGFNFYTPVQHARLDSSGDADWLYNYKKFNNDDNLPTLNAFAISHLPAPWMHDYDQMQIMPQLGSEPIKAKANERSYEYTHDNEVAHPDYYSVKFNNDLKVEIAPSDHSAIFKFTFPKSETTGRLIFDSLFKTNSGMTRGTDKFILTDNTISGYVDNGAWGSGNYRGGQTRMFIYGEFNSNLTAKTAIGDFNTPRTYAEFSLNSQKTVELKIATSFISLVQAKHNLDLEIKNEKLDFYKLSKRATKIWNEKLNVLDIKKANASEEQKKIIYGCLYRLNMYPNASFENVATANNPIYKHVSSALPTIGEPTDITTNAQIFDGKTYVNNGFWDTYRTFWPLYSILYPNFLNELINGFLYQYKEGGFVSRWSAPGYTDCMTGTSSDCAFADGYINGTITNIDTAINIYKSGLADAFRYSPDPNVGRKGIDKSMYRGWTAKGDYSNDGKDTNTLDWDFQGWINDYALGQVAIKLSNDSNLTDQKAANDIQQTKQQIRDTGQYLLNRANNYVNLFNPSKDTEAPNNVNTAGFFRSKEDDGSWFKHDSSTTRNNDNYYDARQWGYENVEANGWNFAFTPTYDIEGLINCYGGQSNLISKLDDLFTIPETGQHMGSIQWGVYSFTRETRDVGFGQCVITNQPSHHLPYMYALAGCPAKTQWLTRAMLHRLFTGSDIGQGYCGDEDNGEMSSWYILSMLGLYDVALGKNEYVITSPMLDNVTIRRDNGNKINIRTNDKIGDKYYIQSAQMDDHDLSQAIISASDLLNGNHTISYKMTNTPTAWADKTINGQQRHTMFNQCLNNGFTTTDAVTNIGNLTDGNALTSASASTPTITLTWNPSTAIAISKVGLTSATQHNNFNNIKLEGFDGSNWVTIINVQNQVIGNPYDTRIYGSNNTISYSQYRLTIQNQLNNWSLAEVQLL